MTLKIAPDNYIIPQCGGGGWRRVAHINISAGDDCPDGWLHILVLASVGWLTMIATLVLLLTSPQMEQTTTRFVPEVTRKDILGHFGDVMKQRQ